MKRLFYFGLIILLGNVAYSQVIPNVDVKKRKEYVMKTYKVDKNKANQYEHILSSLQEENYRLKEKKISSVQFVADQKKLYKKYGEIISNTFTKGKYKTWSYCNQELEWYQLLSDYKLIPYETMRILYKTEKEWVNKRRQLWNGSNEEWTKHEKSESMLAEQEDELRQILGLDNGNWYINYKKLYFRALANMDKYETTFKDALSIANIEQEYKQKRNDILNKGKKYAEIELELLSNDDEMSNAIANIAPSAHNNWKKVNNAILDYELNAKYGLTQAQITQFKTAYNKYSIEEYKIRNQKKVSNTEKYNQVCQANEAFCQIVNPLFKVENYKKWYGWWKFSFERRMKKLGLK